MKGRKIFLILAGILFFAALVRFYNFDHRVTFWSEQARSLIVSSDYLTKPSFLGQDYFVRHDSYGRVLFAGALFNYLLVPFVYLTHDVVLITALFTLLNILTGVAVYFITRKIFGLKTAIFAATVFLFNDMMIYHSLFIWIYNFLPLIGLSSFYLLYLYYFVKPRRIYSFLLGLLSGFGMSLQILYAPTALLVGIFILFKSSKKKLSALVCYLLGIILINLPMIIFDFRHDFYHLRTYFQYFLDTVRGASNAGITYYHFLQFWPILAILLALMMVQIYKINKSLAVIFLAIYLIANTFSQNVNFNRPTGTPGGLFASELDLASKKIAQDATDPFNVASLLDFDKRAYTLRYFVQYKYGREPMAVEDYPKAKRLYVLAEKGYDFKKSNVWEITSGGPYNVTEFVNINPNYSIFKLTK